VKKQNLVFVGFRGAGKTKFGRMLAEKMNLPFADLDAEIEFVLGESIESCIDKGGFHIFRDIEQRVTHDFCRNFSGVIATGAGTIENSKNLQNLKKTGTFLFLNPNFSDVKKYLMSGGKFPRMNSEIPLAQEIDQMWMQRKDIYAATSDIEICPSLNPKDDINKELEKIITQIPQNMIPNPPKKKRIAIFSSSGGTTMQGIFDAQKRGRIPNVEFSLFITNKKDAPALEKAKIEGIKNIEIIEKDPEQSREDYDRGLINVLREHNPDSILLLGWMQILSPTFCEQFGSISINTHPSLLPKFSGLMDEAVHAQVLEHEEKWTGCTLHKISAEVDTGEIVLQRKILVDEVNDDVKSLKIKVQKQEILGFCEFLELR
jgi:phosphoribosylglycinamide formyltransferase-1